MRRVLLLSALLIATTLCVVAQVQETKLQTKGFCPRPRELTREKTKAGDTGDVWTTEKSNRDGILSFSSCWFYQESPLTITRLTPMSMLELPAGFEPHVKYGEMVRAVRRRFIRSGRL